ncbi:MAG TPA: SDR family NAD(P)-dependent oxidoreductase [Pyrinomonadaceae bacterium]|nr:SDR family NAD(P)-dependent oxidoreductase [Pyrinomonadaceae bacterium]
MPEKKGYSLLENILFPPKFCDEKKLADSLQGKTVLITGASFGIGENLSHKLAETGAKLILVARTAEKLEQIKNELETKFPNSKITIFPTDLTNEEQVEKLLEVLKSLPNGIDVFVNNAGKSIRRPLFESLERFHDFKRTMNLNYFGPAQLMLGLIPLLQKNKGHVINISAVNVLLIPAPFWAAYQASKSAFDQWFRCAAPELEAVGIKTTSVYLPLVRTRMIEPTAEYKNAPAMSPEHVVKIICRAIYLKKKIFKPWWLIFGQISSVIFRRPTEFFMNKWLKDKQNRKSLER